MIRETALNTFNEVIQTANIMSIVLYIHQSQKLPWCFCSKKNSLLGRVCIFSYDYIKQTMETEAEKETPILYNPYRFCRQILYIQTWTSVPRKVSWMSVKKQTHALSKMNAKWSMFFMNRNSFTTALWQSVKHED